MKIDAYRLQEVLDLPEDATEMEPGVLYMERRTSGDASTDPFVAAMICPCGCGHNYKLALQGFDTRPQWTLTVNEETPSLHPSVVHTRGCLAHFFLTNGRIQWC